MPDNVIPIIKLVVEGVFGVLLFTACVYIILLRRRIRELSSVEMQTTMSEISKTVSHLQHGLGEQLAEAREISETLSRLIREAQSWESELSDGVDQLSRTVARANQVRERLDQFEVNAASAVEPPAEPKGLTPDPGPVAAEPSDGSVQAAAPTEATTPEKASTGNGDARKTVATASEIRENTSQTRANGDGRSNGAASGRGLRRLIGSSSPHGHGNA